MLLGLLIEFLARFAKETSFLAVCVCLAAEV